MNSLDCEGQEQSMVQNILVLIGGHVVGYSNIAILKKRKKERKGEKKGKLKSTIKVLLKQRMNNVCAFWPL